MNGQMRTIIMILLMVGLAVSQTTVSLEWSRVFSSGTAFNGDFGSFVALDGNGNIFVAGQRIQSDYTSDVLILKYASDGTLLDSAVFNGSANKFDDVKDLIVDSHGNVYVAIQSDQADNTENIVLLAYDNDLNLRWRLDYDGNAGLSDVPKALALDDLGNVYLTGNSMEGNSGFTPPDLLVLKISADGAQQWAYHYDGFQEYDEGIDLLVDRWGNVYVVGHSNDSQSKPDMVIIKLDSLGNEVWVDRYAGASSSNDLPVALALSADHNSLYVTGLSNESGSMDILLLKYRSDGVRQWTRVYDNPQKTGDEPDAIRVSADGRIYVAGTIGGSLFDTERNFVLLQYDADGNLNWVADYNGPGDSWDDLNAMALDIQGNVYVTGQSNGGGSGPDFATLRFNAAGQMEWEQRFSSAGDKSDQAMDIAVDEQGNVYVVGTTSIDSVGSAIAILKYDQNPVAPGLVSPANGQTDLDVSVTLVWNAVQGADNYRLQLAKDSLFAQLVREETVVGDTAFTVSGLEYLTTYYWRVQAVNFTGASEWSPTWHFTTGLQRPGAVVLVSPENQATVSADSVQLVWQKAEPMVTAYWVEVATDSLFAISEIDSQVTDTTKWVTHLQNGQKYWWRVRAKNAAGWGEFSEVRTFQVNITGIDVPAQRPTVFVLEQNFPNPFNPVTTIRYGIPFRSKVVLEIYNTLGQRIATLVNQEQSPSYYQVTWEAQVPTGIYFYKLEAVDVNNPANRFVQIRKMVVLK
ncbi:MAG: T9SS type A sorting domain-containing protein [Calditrichaeota bacterium]|nr:T9SS type A sorting domain-containing protein [Calditrichota bacterium]